MIYRNSARNKTAAKPCVEMLVLPSDTKLSPSISVTHEEASSSAPSISVDKGHFQSSSCTNIASALPTSSEIRHHEKPALPPKPQWTQYVLVEEEKTSSGANSSVTTNGAGTSPSPSYYQSGTVVMDETHSKMNTQERELNPPQPLDESSQYQSNGVQMERNITQKINAAEEIQMCMMKYAEEGKHETNLSVKAALQNIERKDAKRGPVFCKKVKVTDPKDIDSFPQPKSPPSLARKNGQTQTQTISTYTPDVACNESPKRTREEKQADVDKVVLREKKVRETEEQRRQRLSVHMDEIVKGNVKVAMEIFENLRKRDELQGVLDQVHVIEGDRRSMTDKLLTKPYKGYPVGDATGTNSKHETTDEKFEADSQEDDVESISSVDTAYEDLEKASKDIMLLKEQTIAKLLDIEETIKNALCSVSNLKSEADIAGLSGLFDETLRSEQHPQPTNNIRKISIGSCKSKPGRNQEASSTASGLKPKSQRLVQPRQSPSQSSPSFISIHSAARKPAEQPKPKMTTFTPKSDTKTHCCHKENSDASRAPPQRKVSVLEFKTGPGQPPVGVIDKKMVSETYEETDGFGNVFMSSTTSTVVHKKSDSQSSALFEVVPPRCEIVTSPLMHRHHFEDQVLKSKGEGNVFVTFSPSMNKH
ncbi:xin actin-binding repeat-containing protein 1-like [Eucyclogobius newberryi]|uniref:xin actin-binding repeat-containing protein 1-like n=1 Tax=Eucyclogobius newberryi TaxID=166745 RepID=UPI003B59EC2F